MSKERTRSFTDRLQREFTRQWRPRGDTRPRIYKMINISICICHDIHFVELHVRFAGGQSVFAFRWSEVGQSEFPPSLIAAIIIDEWKTREICLSHAR